MDSKVPHLMTFSTTMLQNGADLSLFFKWPSQYHSTPRKPPPFAYRWLNRQWMIKHGGFASNFIRARSTVVSTISPKTHVSFHFPLFNVWWTWPGKHSSVVSRESTSFTNLTSTTLVVFESNSPRFSRKVQLF